jgi:hypothetical protein
MSSAVEKHFFICWITKLEPQKHCGEGEKNVKNGHLILNIFFFCFFQKNQGNRNPTNKKKWHINPQNMIFISECSLIDFRQI